MNRVFSFFIFLLLLMPVLSSAVEIMPLSEVKAGMKGYGVTVVRGKKRVRFNVEVLGVLDNVAPKRSVILAKFTGKNIKLSGIAKGMSGSPIYINGKLVGALAYTWGYLKEAIGGIQPIESMMPVLNTAKKGKKAPFEFIPLDKKLAKAMNIKIPLKYSSNSQIKPIATPLMISGFSPSVFAFFKEKFEKMGFTVLQGGGGSKIKEDSSPFKPGDPVGIPMAVGDVNMAAIGTVTHVDKNKVLIFGHPFMNKGSMSLPLSKAFVHYVLPSLQVSWKFASSTKIVGTAYNDKETAVAGVLGKTPKLLPVKLTVNKAGEKTVYKYKIVKDPLFFPNIFVGSIMSSFTSNDSKMAEGSLALEFTLKIKEKKTGKIKTLKLKDFFIGQNAQTVYMALFKMVRPIQYLLYNWFSEVELKSIDVKLKKVQQYQVAALDKAVVLTAHPKAGEKVRVKLYFRLYKNGYSSKEIEFYIPADYKSNVLYLNISNAKMEHTSANYLYAARFVPKSFNQLIASLQRNSSYNDVAVWIDVPKTGAVVNGYYLPNLPLSKLTDYAFRERGNFFVRSRRKLNYFKTNYYVAGHIMVPVRLESDE